MKSSRFQTAIKGKLESGSFRILSAVSAHFVSLLHCWIPFDLINAGELTKSAFYAWSEEARKKKENCDNGAITPEEFSQWLKES